MVKRNPKGMCDYTHYLPDSDTAPTVVPGEGNEFSSNPHDHGIVPIAPIEGVPDMAAWERPSSTAEGVPEEVKQAVSAVIFSNYPALIGRERLMAELNQKLFTALAPALGKTAGEGEAARKASEEIVEHLYGDRFVGDEDNSAAGHRGELELEIEAIIASHFSVQPPPTSGTGARKHLPERLKRAVYGAISANSDKAGNITSPPDELAEDIVKQVARVWDKECQCAGGFTRAIGRDNEELVTECPHCKQPTSTFMPQCPNHPKS